MSDKVGEMLREIMQDYITLASERDELMQARNGLIENNDNLHIQLAEMRAQRDEGLVREEDLRKALEDANSLCRSCYQVVERIAIIEGDVAFGSAFGRLQESLRGSLERQHRVMFPKEASPSCADGEKAK